MAEFVEAAGVVGVSPEYARAVVTHRLRSEIGKEYSGGDG